MHAFLVFEEEQGIRVHSLQSESHILSLLKPEESIKNVNFDLLSHPHSGISEVGIDIANMIL
jgi:hypothetical protein